MRVVILTGASGSGKTTIADAIRTASRDLVDVFHFDEIGVPSPEAMVMRWGSVEAWQHAMTLAWMERIASERYDQARSILLEGQMRIAFVNQGLDAAGLTGAHTILLDCDDESRTRRLVLERKQPALANPTMMDWAAYLRREARDAGIEVLDTARMSLKGSVRLVRERLGAA